MLSSEPLFFCVKKKKRQRKHAAWLQTVGDPELYVTDQGIGKGKHRTMILEVLAISAVDNDHKPCNYILLPGGFRYKKIQPEPQISDQR